MLDFGLYILFCVFLGFGWLGSGFLSGTRGRGGCWGFSQFRLLVGFGSVSCRFGGEWKCGVHGCGFYRSSCFVLQLYFYSCRCSSSRDIEERKYLVSILFSSCKNCCILVKN